MRNITTVAAALLFAGLALAPHAAADEVPDPPESESSSEGGGGCSVGPADRPLRAGLAWGGLAATLGLLAARRRRDV